MSFRSSKRLDSGERVIAAVKWPSAVGRPLILLIHGHVVWIKGPQVGITVSHYGFLPDNIPEDADLETLNSLASPFHLTPTKATPLASGSVRQWNRSVPHWKN